MRVADYIMKFVAQLGVKYIFSIPGGGSMHLNDAVGRNTNVQHISMHHEQAIAMAVEAYSRVKGFGVGLVTTGPGGTNTITGLVGAWIDSTPCMIISGQIALKDTILNTKLRQRGVQEVDIISIVKPITKYAEMVTDANKIKYHLQKAVYIAKSGRNGPVWLDIPLDVQGTLIDEKNLEEFVPSKKDKINCDSPRELKKKVSECIEILKNAERPIFWIGNGLKLSGAEKEFEQLINRVKIPVLTTWNGADLIEDAHELYIGRPGLFGQRGANFAAQNADVIITIGNRLSIPQTGYDFKAFARAAKKIFVDIDKSELTDKPFKPDIAINADAKDFLIELNRQAGKLNEYNAKDWLHICKNWNVKYPMVLPEYREKNDYVNSYVFIDKLSDELDNSDVIVTDMGTSFTTTFQTFKVKKGQRIFTSSGLASMGFGLPGAIGACFANDEKRTICLTGEGSFMFNIQEMQTVMHHNLPIKIFLFNNKVYLSVKLMQDTNFGGLRVGSDEKSGVSFPDMSKVAQAFGFRTYKISNHSELNKINSVLETDGPVFCEVLLDPDEVLSPRLKTKVKKDGSMSQSPLEDMWPFLDREEFKRNMIIPPLDD